MTIGTIVVDLLARTGSFETDINRSAKLAEKRAKEIDAAVTSAGAAIGVALGAAGAAALAMAKNIIDGLDALNDVKDATGASIANISALEDVALRTGIGLYYQVGAQGETLKDVKDQLKSLQIAINAGNNQAMTLAGEIAILKFRIENLESDRKASR